MRHNISQSSGWVRRMVLVASVLILPAMLPGCADAPSNQVVTKTPLAHGSMDSYIQEASARFNVPEKWIRAVMKQESGGHTHINGQPIVSKKGAMGLMQLMPGTWALMRDAYKLGNDPFDPHDNIMAGTAYIREMYDLYGSPGFLAAYNAGPGRYESHLKTNRPLPGETRHYVAVIGPQIAGILPEGPAPSRGAPAAPAPVLVAALPAAPAVASVPATVPFAATAVVSTPIVSTPVVPAPVTVAPVAMAEPPRPVVKPAQATPAAPVQMAAVALPPPVVKQQAMLQAKPQAKPQPQAKPVVPALVAARSQAHPVQVASAVTGRPLPRPLPAVRQTVAARGTPVVRSVQVADAEAGHRNVANGQGTVARRPGSLPPGWYVPVAESHSRKPG